MKHGGNIAPIAAALMALTTLACCLPIAFAGAAVSASIGAVVAAHRAWFLGISILLVAVGAAQIRRARRTCRTRQTGSIAIVATSGLIVVLVIVFPQLIAGLIADVWP
jgi:hypothetical protein